MTTFILAPWTRRPAILCGDLNTPQYEARGGTVQTFAQTRTGRLRPGRGERHDRAERMILSGPPGWQDAFRALRRAVAPSGARARYRGTLPSVERGAAGVLRVRG